jgi:hypothetical protein
MPLQDHFHPPLSSRRHWHAFSSSWATYPAADLNRQLPPGYVAEANVQFGIEIEVATFEEAGREGAGPAAVWTPPAPTVTTPFVVATDVIEVQVYAAEGGPTLAAAVELVSPANKDRAAHRDTFVAKCATYLRLGLGLVIVDVVTDRRANLHNGLAARLDAGEVTLEADLYAVAYRAVARDGQTSLDLWQVRLAVGQPLPSLPLYLRGEGPLRVDLEVTYERTCQEQRVPRNGAS